MPEVTVTFQEEGQDPAGFTIPAWVVANLQQFVDENPTLYSGKADLFAKWITERLIAPVCERYGNYPEEVQTAMAGLAAAQATTQAAIQTAMASAVTPFSIEP